MQASSGRRALGIALAVAALQMVMLVAFAWPAARSAPHDLPIAVTGPQAAAVADRLAGQGGFAVETLPDEAAARQALRDREVYGAIVTAPAGPKVLVASGASPAVAQQIGQYAATLSGAPAPPVTDVVPAGEHGAAFASLALPLVMSGIAGGALLALLVRGTGPRLAGLAGVAVLGGLGSAALAQGWLGILDGSYLAVSGTIALAVAAISGTVLGLAALIGPPGIVVGALTMLLLGNPLSAAATAPELLPEPWGDLGQLLPPGAAVTLLRSAGYFDGAAAARPLTVLAVWALAGTALVVLGGLRRPGGRTRDNGAHAAPAGA
ncbi:ABC transporter permease [Thermomonospora amylolytica]|uniref:ABC transporter permease n=1 Tax=Thermomonospora amylolytica TaxID=1411117 RepID=UPI000E6CFF7A|nr:ABC transporter permease [Thermomonospora amylolytica]